MDWNFELVIVPSHNPSKSKLPFVAGSDAILHVVCPWLNNGVEIWSVHEVEHGDDGGGRRAAHYRRLRRDR